MLGLTPSTRKVRVVCVHSIMACPPWPKTNQRTHQYHVTNFNGTPMYSSACPRRPSILIGLREHRSRRLGVAPRHQCPEQLRRGHHPGQSSCVVLCPRTRDSHISLSGLVTKELQETGVSYLLTVHQSNETSVNKLK